MDISVVPEYLGGQNQNIDAEFIKTPETPRKEE